MPSFSRSPWPRSSIAANAAALQGWAALFVTDALALTPWLAYNYVNLGQITLFAAGGIGRGCGKAAGRDDGRASAEGVTTLRT